MAWSNTCCLYALQVRCFPGICFLVHNLTIREMTFGLLLYVVSRLGWASSKGCPAWQCCCLPRRQGGSLAPAPAGHSHLLPRKKVKRREAILLILLWSWGMLHAACAGPVFYLVTEIHWQLCAQSSFLWILLPQASCSYKCFFLCPSCVLCQPLQGIISVERKMEVSLPPWLPPSHREGSDQCLCWWQVWGFVTAGAST